MFRGLDRGEHGGERGVAIGEHDVGVAGGERMTEQPRQVLGKPPVVSCEGCLDAERFLVLGNQQSGGNDQDPDRQSRG